ncbi:MAG: hypothetical protein FGM58_06230 [Acidimicrobiia bacterium]|nr:hypothetical protein [Acidimicrobiia bacterium]
MNRRRFLLPAVVLLLALGPVLSACSSARDSDTQRSAADAEVAAASGIDTTGYSRPRGNPYVSVNKDDWCLRPQNDNGDSGFQWVRSATVCNVMTNRTRKFTAPGVLGGKFPLGVTKAGCSFDDHTCVSEGPHYGAVRTEGVWAQNAEMKGPRYTYPNPFFGTAAIQFMPNKIFQGVTTTTYVGSNMAPYSLQQAQAELYVSLPYSTTSTVFSCVNGSFITCRIAGGATQDYNPKVDWDLGNLPLQITINNNSGRSMSLQAGSEPVPGAGLLVDPAGTSPDLATIPTGGRVFIGAYRSAGSKDGHSWTANYCIDSLSGCVPVTITIKMEYESDKWVNKSTCIVSNTSATATFKCNTPSLTDSDDYRQAIVSITNF